MSQPLPFKQTAKASFMVYSCCRYCSLDLKSPAHSQDWIKSYVYFIPIMWYWDLKFSDADYEDTEQAFASMDTEKED